MSTAGKSHYRFASGTLDALLSIAMLLLPIPAGAEDYLTIRKWLQAVDDAAAARVTYEICGWGPIDLLTPLLTAGQHEGFRHLTLDELAKRYDEELRERRRTEAVLTAQGSNAPSQRFTGLYATGGCSDAIRERIERASRAED
jgi:hypothetical protein